MKHGRATETTQHNNQCRTIRDHLQASTAEGANSNPFMTNKGFVSSDDRNLISEPLEVAIN